MSEETIKRQVRRAKSAAIEKCEEMNYRIIPSDNSLFCFLAVRKMEIRMIRVIVGAISEKEIEEVRRFIPPGTCSKEIWRWHDNRKFIIQDIS